MKKCNKTTSVITFIFLFASFLFLPLSNVMAEEATSEQTSSDTDKKADKAKKGDKDKKKKGKGEDEEEPDCE